MIRGRNFKHFKTSVGSSRIGTMGHCHTTYCLQTSGDSRRTGTFYQTLSTIECSVCSGKREKYFSCTSLLCILPSLFFVAIFNVYKYFNVKILYFHKKHVAFKSSQIFVSVTFTDGADFFHMLFFYFSHAFKSKSDRSVYT